MAKAKSHYTGTDTYGRSVEMAEREDGVWFERHAVHGHYGWVMSPWASIKAPSFVTECENRYTGEMVTMQDPTAAIWWGFNKLRRLDYKNRLRLPGTWMRAA